MPSLAVYLVAQYARYEIKRMEAEAGVKKKQAEEVEKACFGRRKEEKPSASELTKDQENTEKENLQTVTSKFESKSQDSTTVASDRCRDLNSGSSKPDPSQKRVTGPNPAINDQIDLQKGKLQLLLKITVIAQSPNRPESQLK
ncbi:hypothetical protein IFM89_028818 [Coptis chinensis]|uniref:Uncharacterized protein n=1 Tax=Coptis chinensis TaxID=261450 RepID=A0A835LNW7_9MAGN|nr:hypothetical protein IFM89_028818 [Coptis chinensis]